MDQTLGTLSIGAQQLNVAAGANVNSGTAGLAFGTTTLQSSGAIFDVDSGAGLTLGAVNGNTFGFTVQGAGATTINGVISTTTGTVTKNDTGTLTLAGAANTYTGVTTVNGGTLLLNKTAGANALNGTLVIGDDLGGANADVVRYLADNQLPSAAGNAITINSSGLLDLNGHSATLLVSTMKGGAITTGAGTLTLAGDITVPATATTTATISGNLALGSNRYVHVYDGSQAIDMEISASISGAFCLDNDQLGRLLLSGSNTFSGGLYAGDTGKPGIIRLSNSNAVGTGTAYVYSAGSVLELVGSIAVGARPLSIIGSGQGNSGALLNVSDTNSWAGAITLTGASTIGSDAGQLTLSGGINGAGFGLTFAGAGDVVVTTTKITDSAGASTLTKTGAGMLTLSVNNDYAGATAINGGVLRLNSATALGTANLTINGGVLELQDPTSFTRALGTGASQVQVTGGVSGFSAYGGTRIVNIGNAGATLTWDGATFAPTTLVLNEDTASGTLNFSNAVNLANANRAINVNAATAIMTGVITNNTGAAAGLTKGGGGTLVLQRSDNAYNGTNTITGGILSVATLANGGAKSSLGNSGSQAANLLLNGGTLQYTGGAISINRLFSVGTSNGAIDASGSGALTLNNTGNMGFSGTGARTLTLTGTNTAGNTLAAVIANNSGATALFKDGVGTWILGAVNTYTGGTILNAGVLGLSSSNALGAGLLTMQDGTTLSNTTDLSAGAGVTNVISLAGGATFSVASGNLLLSGLITNTGSLTVQGTGILILGTNNTYSGGTVVQSGTLKLNSAGAFPGNALTVNGGIFDQNGNAITVTTLTGTGGTITNAGLTVNSGGSFAGVIAGSGRLVQNGGTLALSGANTFSGGTTISNGALLAANNAALGSGAVITIADAALQLSNTVTIANSLTLAGTGVSNSGALRNVSGNNTYSGVINLGSAARINSDTNLLTISGNITNNGFGLTVGGTSNTTVSGRLVGSGGLVKDGGGTLTLTGANTYSGGTIVSNGTLQAGANFVITNTAALTVVTGATFTNNFQQAIGSLAGGGNIILGATGALSNGFANTSTTFSGVISGPGRVDKFGTGTLLLSGTNTYAGTTTVNAGRLLLDGGQITNAAGTVTIGTGAAVASVIISNGGGLFGGNITVGNNSALNALTVSNAGNVFFGSLLTIGNGAAGSNNTILVTGANAALKSTSNTGTIVIGTAGGTGNGLIVAAGASLTSSNISLGYTPNSSNNYYSIGGLGARSTVTNGIISIGAGEISPTALTFNSGGGFNSFTITNANLVSGKLASGVGVTIGMFSSNNTATVLANSTWNLSGGALALGFLGGNSNVMTINSGTVTNVSIVAVGDRASGTGTTSPDFNSLVISNGAQLWSAYDGSVSNTPGSMIGNSGNSNTVTVTGANSRWNLDNVAVLVVGANGTTLDPYGNPFGGSTGNVLNVINGGTVVATSVVISATATDFGNQINLNGGTLIVTNAAGTGALIVGRANQGAFVSSGSSTTIVDQLIATNSAAEVSFTGGRVRVNTSLIFAGTNTVSGNQLFTIGDGATAATLELGGGNYSFANGVSNSASGALRGSGVVTGNIVNVLGGTITATNGELRLTGVLSGAGTNLAGSTGTLTLNNANTFTGLTAINGGQLAVGNVNAVQNSTVSNTTANNGIAFTVTSANFGGLAGTGNFALTNGAIGVALSVGANNANTTYSGGLSGNGSLAKTGTGTLILSGADSYTGGTVIQSGTLKLNSAGAFPGSALTVNGGIFDQNGNAITVTTLTGTGGTITNAGLTVNSGGSFAGIIAGTGALTNNGGVLILSGNDTYTGGTVIQSGTLKLNSAGAFPGNALTVNGGIFDQNGNAITVTTLTGTGGTITNAGLMVNNGGNFAGVIAGTGALTNNGGVLILSGTNTYTGGTVIQSGTLQLNVARALPANTAVTVAGSGTLSVQQAWQNGGTITLAGGVLAGSTVTNAALITGNGLISAALANNGLLRATNGTLTVTGNFSGTGTNFVGSTGTLTLNSANTFTGLTAIDGGQLVVGNVNAVQFGTISNTTATSGIAFAVNRANFGGLAGTGDFELANGAAGVALSVGANNIDSTYSGVLSGNGSLTKTGTGTLMLSGINDYSGGTVVNVGTLAVQENSAFGSGTITNTATVELNGSAPLTVANNLVLNNGTVVVASGAGGSVWNGGVTLLNANVMNTPGSITLNGVISGTGSLTKLGAGDLILTNANTFAGTTTINAGHVVVSNQNALQNSTVTDTAGGVRLAAGIAGFNFGGLAGNQNFALTNADGEAIALTVGANGATTVYSGVLSEAGLLIKNGTGTLTISANNTYSGGTILSNGWLALGHNNALGTSNLTMAGGTVTITGTRFITNAVTLASDGTFDTAGNSLTLRGVIAGANDLIKTGGGTLTFLGTNTYSGATVINAGAIVLAQAGGLTNSTVTPNVNGGLLFSNATSFIVGGLAGAGNVTLQNAAGAAVELIVGNNGASTVYGGVLSGSGALTKIGGGKLELTNANLYTGSTIVNAGTLAINNSFASSTITVNGGALGGTGTIAGAVSVNAGGTLAPGNSIGLQHMGTLTLNAGSILNFQFQPNAPGSLNDQIVVDGASGLTINDGGFNLLTATGTNPNDNSQRFTDIGSYNLINYSGTLGGLGIGTLSILNPAGNRSYAFGDSGSWITLTIGGQGIGWNGLAGAPGNWSDSNNWNMAMAQGDLLVFDGNTTIANNNDFAANTWFSGIVFSNTASSFVLTGNALALAGSVENFSRSTQTIDMALVLTNGSHIFAAAAGNISVNGTVSQSGGSYGIVKTGAATLILNGTNTFTGAIEIQGGAVRVTDGVGLPTASNLKLNGGVLESAGTFTRSLGTIPGAVQWTGSGGFSAHGDTLTVNINNDAGTLTWGGTANFVSSGSALKFGSSGADNTVRFVNPLNLNGAVQTINVDGTAALGVDFLGAISGTGNSGLIKTGAGAMQLSANSSYAGATTVEAGTLIVNGTLASSTVSLSKGAVLAGVGTLEGIVSGSGLIAPGTDGPGILTLNQLSPAAGLSFNFEFTNSGSPDYTNAGASSNDVLRITNAVPFAAALTLANTVNLYVNATLTPGITNIFYGGFYTDQNQLFDNLITGATYNVYLNNTLIGAPLFVTTMNETGLQFGGKNGYVMQFGVLGPAITEAVPEPNVLLMWLAGMTTFWLARRRRKLSQTGLQDSVNSGGRTG